MSAPVYNISVDGNNNDSNIILGSTNGSIQEDDMHDHGEITNKLNELETALNTNSASDLAQAALVDANASGISTNASGVATNLSRLDIHESLVLKNINDISSNVATLAVHEGLVLKNINDISSNVATLAVHEGLVTQNIATLDVHESLVLNNIAKIEALNAGLGEQSSVTMLDASNNLNIIGTQEVFLLDCILDQYAVDPIWGEGILEIWEYGTALGSVNTLLKRIELNSIKDKMIPGIGNTFKFSTKLVLPPLKTYFIRFIDTYGDAITGGDIWPVDENGDDIPALVLKKQDGTIVHRVPRQVSYDVYFGALPTHDPSFGTTWQQAENGEVYIDSDTFPFSTKWQLESFDYAQPNKTEPIMFGKEYLEAVPSVLNVSQEDETFLDNLDQELATLTPNSVEYFTKLFESYYDKQLGFRLDLDPKEAHWTDNFGLGSWGFSGQSVELNQKTYYISSIIDGVLMEYDNVTKTSRSFPMVTEINNNEAKFITYGNAGRKYLTGDPATNSIYIFGAVQKIKNGRGLAAVNENPGVWKFFKVTQEVDSNGVGRLPTFTANSNNYFEIIPIDEYPRVDNNNVFFDVWPLPNNGSNLVPTRQIQFNSYDFLEFQNIREFRILNNEIVLLHTSSKVVGLKAQDNVETTWGVLNNPKASTLFDIPQSKIDELANLILAIDASSGVVSFKPEYENYDSSDPSGTYDFIGIVNSTLNISKEKLLRMNLLKTVGEETDSVCLTKFDMTNKTFKQTKFFNDRFLEADMLDANGNQQYEIQTDHRGTIELISDRQNNIWVVGYGRIRSGPGAMDRNTAGFWNIPANFANGDNINAISGLTHLDKDGFSASLFWNAAHIGKTKYDAFAFNANGFLKVKSDFAMHEQPTEITNGRLDLKYYFSQLNKQCVVRGSYKISDTQALIVINLSPSWGSDADWQTFNLKENGHSVAVILDSETNSVVKSIFLKSSLEDYDGKPVKLPISMHSRNFEAVAYDFVNKKITFLPSFYAENAVNPSKTQEPTYIWYPADYSIDLLASSSLKTKAKVENKVPRKALKPRKETKGLDQYL